MKVHFSLEVVGLLLGLAALGCSDSGYDHSGDDEFEALVNASISELEVKNDAHKAWGMATYERWSFDQSDGNLVFSKSDGAIAAAPAQVIGSFSKADNSWLWAWDNPSVNADLKAHSLKLKEYGEQHGIERLTTGTWIGTEADAWAMVALAVKLCDARGAYRGPGTSSDIFMTFGEVKFSKSPNSE